MARKEDHHQIWEEDFKAIDRIIGRQQQQQRYLYHRSEVPPETAPSPYVIYRRTRVSQVPQRFFPSPPPPPEPPRGFLSSRFFPAKGQNPPKRMIGERRGFPPLGANLVEYPPQEQHENWPEGRVPAAEAGAMNNIEAAQLFGGVTRVDRGWF